MCSCENTASHCGQRRSTYRTFRSRQIADATSRRGVGARETISFVSIGATLPRFRKFGEGSELASSSRICDTCSWKNPTLSQFHPVMLLGSLCPSAKDHGKRDRWTRMTCSSSDISQEKVGDLTVAELHEHWSNLRPSLRLWLSYSVVCYSLLGLWSIHTLPCFWIDELGGFTERTGNALNFTLTLK